MRNIAIDVAAVVYGIGYALPRAFMRAIRRLKFNWYLFAALIALNLPKLVSLIREALQ